MVGATQLKSSYSENDMGGRGVMEDPKMNMNQWSALTAKKITVSWAALGKVLTIS